MTDDNHRHRTPLDHALDFFVYAPLGFMAEAPSLLPRFAQRGRDQVALVQAIGLSALRRDPSELDDVLSDHPEVRSRMQALGLVPRDAPTPATNEGSSTPVATAAEPAGGPAAGSLTETPAVNTSGVEPESLAILEYDSLSASQVVPRLEGLTADELDAVRRYENGNRARRTILNKIAQLQSS